jgi:hypothetical protein
MQAQAMEYTAIMDEVNKLKVNENDDPLYVEVSPWCSARVMTH